MKKRQHAASCRATFVVPQQPAERLVADDVVQSIGSGMGKLAWSIDTSPSRRHKQRCFLMQTVLTSGRQ